MFKNDLRPQRRFYFCFPWRLDWTCIWLNGQVWELGRSTEISIVYCWKQIFTLHKIQLRCLCLCLPFHHPKFQTHIHASATKLWLPKTRIHLSLLLISCRLGYHGTGSNQSPYNIITRTNNEGALSQVLIPYLPSHQCIIRWWSPGHLRTSGAPSTRAKTTLRHCFCIAQDLSPRWCRPSMSMTMSMSGRRNGRWCSRRTTSRHRVLNRCLQLRLTCCSQCIVR